MNNHPADDFVAVQQKPRPTAMSNGFRNLFRRMKFPPT